MNSTITYNEGKPGTIKSMVSRLDWEFLIPIVIDFIMNIIEIVGVAMLYKPIWKTAKVGKPLQLWNAKNKTFIKSTVVFLWMDVFNSVRNISEYIIKVKNNNNVVGFLGLVSVFAIIVTSIGLGYLSELVFNSSKNVTKNHLVMIRLFWVSFLVYYPLSFCAKVMTIIHDKKNGSK